MGFLFESLLSIIWDICQTIYGNSMLLDDTVILYLIFRTTTILFATAASPFCISISSTQRLPFLYMFANTCYFVCAVSSFFLHLGFFCLFLLCVWFLFLFCIGAMLMGQGWQIWFSFNQRDVSIFKVCKMLTVGKHGQYWSPLLSLEFSQIHGCVFMHAVQATWHWPLLSHCGFVRSSGFWVIKGKWNSVPVTFVLFLGQRLAKVFCEVLDSKHY